MKKLAHENLDVLEVLAAFDQRGFKAVVECSTQLKVIPLRDRDPLVKASMEEDVEVIAAIVDQDERKLTAYEGKLKQLGADYGFMLV